MAELLPPSIAFLLGNIDDFKAKWGEAVTISEEADSKIGKAGALGQKAFLAVGAAIGATVVEALRLSTVFDATMARINTQDNAGLTTAQMKALKASVLDLAGPTAQAPEALAEAMVHVYGSGLKGAQALDLLKVAAEGATTGHANLVDVTNALDAAVAVGIKGTGDYSQAMGELNATVGAGDMTMQNLAEALGGPMLATVKGYGLNITDVGAALAVFGDRNIRGAEAATELRMAVQALAVPAASGGKALASIGLGTDSLRKDLQEGGLNQALNDLNDHLLAAGYNSTTSGTLITEAFGKKAGGGLNILMDSMNSATSSFNEKFASISATGKTFAADFAQTQDTLAFKLKSLGATAEAEGVKLGEYLTPGVSRFVDVVSRDAVPAVEAFGTKVVDALRSPGAQEAADILRATWKDLSAGFRDGAAAVANLLAAVEPAAAFLGGVFLAGLRAGAEMLRVLGEALKAVTGFLRDHAEVIKLVAEVVLPVLITRLVYLKTLVAIDMFTRFVAGLTAASSAIRGFTTAVASGAVFNDLRVKVGAAGDAVRTLTMSTEAAAAAQKAVALDMALAGAAAKANAGSVALLSASTRTAGESAEIAAAAEEALSARMGVLAAAAGISAKEVQAVAAANTEATAAAQANAAANAENAASLGKSIPVIGAVIAGAGMLGNYLGHLAGVGDHTALDLDKTTSALLDMTQGSQTATDGLDRLALQLATATSKVNGNDAVQGMKDLDNSLAQLVSSGHIQEASAAFVQLQKYLEANGYSIGYQNEHLFPAFQKAMADSAVQARLTGDATAAAGANFGPLLTGALSGAKQAAEDLNMQLQAIDESYQTLSGHLSEQGILDNFKKDLLSVKDAVAQNGTAFDDTTLKGLANRDAYRQALQQIIQYRNETVKNGTVLPEQADKIAAAQIADLQKTWLQAGVNTKQFQDYIATLDMIPPNISTTLTLQTLGLSAVMQGLQQVLNLENQVGNSGYGRVTVPAMAAGGEVVGAGTPTSDSNLRALSNREWVISAAGASQFPRQFLDAVNRGDVSAARGALGAVLTMPAPSAPAAGGGVSTPSDVAVTVYVQAPGQAGYKQAREVRKEINRYQTRNSRNGLALSGIAG